MGTLPKLENNISQRAIPVWRLTNIIAEVIFYLIIVGLLWASYYFDWYRWAVIVLWLLVTVIPFGMLWSICFEPKFKQRHWKYGINEHFIYLKYGKFFATETVIPMTKVQFVEAEQGPLLRKYQLYTITIGTLGEKHTIPALSDEEAFSLRAQIASHARLKEVES